VRYKIGDDKIWVSKGQEWQLEHLRSVLSSHVTDNEAIFLAPMLTTLYCVLNRNSPTYETYFVVPKPEDLQKRVTRELDEKKVPWALVGDFPLDGREELSFSRSFHVIWEYLKENFEEVPAGLPPRYFLLRRRTLASVV
jgi:hypothetical protein